MRRALVALGLLALVPLTLYLHAWLRLLEQRRIQQAAWETMPHPTPVADIEAIRARFVRKYYDRREGDD